MTNEKINKAKSRSTMKITSHQVEKCIVSNQKCNIFRDAKSVTSNTTYSSHKTMDMLDTSIINSNVCRPIIVKIK